MTRNRRRVRPNRRSAQSIIETVVGIIFLIPIVLFLFDIGVLVLANTANDNLAKQAARAAASATPNGNVLPILANIPAYRTAAKNAAQSVVDTFAGSGTKGYLRDIKLAKMYYNGSVAASNFAPTSGDDNPGQNQVCVFTRIVAVAPVPFPGFDTTRTFFSKAVEPIVALPPDVNNPQN